MPVTQEFLINLSAFWLAILCSYQVIKFLGGRRGSQ